MKLDTLPPLTPRPDEIVLVRERRRRSVVLHLVDGSSYKLTTPEVETYLRLLGDREPDRVTALVWNFYAVHYNVNTRVAKIVPQSSVREVLGDGYKEGIARV